MAVVVAVACAVYPVATGSRTDGLVPLAGLVGVGMVLAALLWLWEDGLAFGPAVLLLGYALSIASAGSSLDRGAPFFAVGLLAVVELGSWSLELRDGAEQRPLAHLGLVAVLFVAAFAASVFMLAVGSLRADAGIALWAIGAAAALGLFALLSWPSQPCSGPKA